VSQVQCRLVSYQEPYDNRISAVTHWTLDSKLFFQCHPKRPCSHIRPSLTTDCLRDVAWMAAFANSHHFLCKGQQSLPIHHHVTADPDRPAYLPFQVGNMLGHPLIGAGANPGTLPHRSQPYLYEGQVSFMPPHVPMDIHSSQVSTETSLLVGYSACARVS
jgi:hypothetical protein